MTLQAAGAADARAPALSDNDLSRVLRMVDPSDTGRVTFAQFSRAFGGATEAAPPPPGKVVVGSPTGAPEDRTHNRPLHIHSPSREQRRAGDGRGINSGAAVTVEAARRRPSSVAQPATDSEGQPSTPPRSSPEPESSPSFRLGEAPAPRDADAADRADVGEARPTQRPAGTPSGSRNRSQSLVRQAHALPTLQAADPVFDPEARRLGALSRRITDRTAQVIIMSIACSVSHKLR